MAINTTPLANYSDERFAYLVEQEGPGPIVYADPYAIPTLGYGWALVIKNNRTGMWEVRSDINTKLQAANLTQLNTQDLQLLEEIAFNLSIGDAAAARQLLDPPGTNYFSIPPLTPTQARTLFDVVAQDFENRVNSNLYTTVRNSIANSPERLSLVSLAYQKWDAFSPSSPLVQALNREDRAAAWFYIRYEATPDNFGNRRRSESDQFGLFENHNYFTSFTAEEAADVVAYVLHRRDELATNANPDMRLSNAEYADLLSKISAATTLLQTNYTDGDPFDNVYTDKRNYEGIGNSIIRDGTGHDLVLGNATEKNVIWLGNGGNDYAYGGSNSDTFYSTDGNDVMHGKGGADAFALAGTYSAAYGEEGNDDFAVGGNSNTAEGGADDDSFVVNATNSVSVGDGGNDTFTIQSGAGNRLEGGAGNDKYFIGAATGNTTIVDSDGVGFVVLASQLLAGGSRVGTSDTYYYAAGNISYVWTGAGSQLVVNGVLTISNFHNGELGIVLGDQDPANNPPAPNPPGGSPPVASSDQGRGNGDAGNREPYMPAMDDLKDKMDSGIATPSPIILDLDGDGLETSYLTNQSVYFDLTGSGFRSRTSWAVGGDGLLTLDLNGNGFIDSGRELFGNHTALANGTLASNGYLALAQYDSNNDGLIDSADSIYNNLRIWRDTNLDGISQTGELDTLSALGVASISVSFTTNADPNAELRYLSTFTTSGGQQRNTADAFFATNTIDSVAMDYVTESSEVLALPDAYGFGNVRNLRQAMELDRSGILKSLVASYSSNIEEAQDRKSVELIAYAWAGTLGVSPTETVGGLNIRTLRTIEAFLGQTYSLSRGIFADVVHSQALSILLDYVEEALLRQTHLQNFFDESVYDAASRTWLISDPVAYFNDYFEDLFSQDSETAAIELRFLERNRYLSASLPADYEFIGTGGAIFHRSSALNDSIETGVTDDTIVVTGTGSTVSSGDGSDSITVDGASIIVDSGADNDHVMITGGQNSDVSTGDGDDLVDIEPAISATISGGSGNDLIRVRVPDRNDAAAEGGVSIVITGGEGDDHIIGGRANETFRFGFGDGNDIVQDAGGFDTIAFGPGITLSNLAARRDGNNWVIDVRSNAGLELDTRITILGAFYGANNFGIERLHFNDGTVIDGTALWSYVHTQTGTDGNDTLAAWDTESAILAGGRGDDHLVGNSSSQTYSYRRGDGQDTIYDVGTASGATPDTMVFGVGIQQSNLSLSKVGQDLVIKILDPSNTDSADQIRVVNWFVASAFRIESFQFADGSTLTGEQVHAMALVVTGTQNNDTLAGWSEGNTIYGLGGNDTITDTDGDDIIDGGDGDDVITDEGSGTNTLRGGSGNDTITYNYNSDNTLEGGAGNDVLQLNSGYNNSNGHTNSFRGGTGSDRLVGGSSTDTYYFDRGDGQDVVNDSGNWGSATDRIEFGAGITQSNLTFDRNGSHLIVRIADPNNPAATDQITIEYWYLADQFRIESFNFADGSSLTKAQIQALALVLTGTAGADTLSGWDDDNTINGLGGNDAITDTNGNDTIDGGDGDDTIADQGGGTNTLRGGNGNDTVTYSYYSNNTMEGGAGNDVLRPDFSYNNNGYVNTFRGGTGDDRLVGGSSTDTYYFDRGDGQDTIYDSANWGNATDRIVFGAGITQSNLSFGRNGDHLIVRIADPNNASATDQITIEYWYLADQFRVDSFDFADGSSLTKAQVQTMALVLSGTAGADTLAGWDDDNTIYGLAGNDTISDTNGNDTIEGGDGDDVITDQGGGTNTLRGGNGNDTITYSYYSTNTLEGGAGNDVLQLVGGYNNNNGYTNSFRGGTGNDRLVGGSSTDTYYFDRGDGQDVIVDSANWGNATDRIVFGTGITQSDLSYSKSGNDLVIQISDPNNPSATDQIKIEGWYNGDYLRIESFQFADNSSLTKAQVHALAATVTGTSGNDTLSGWWEANTINGLGGNDTITDEDGSDTIDGGDGDDVITDQGGGTNILRGGNGNDTITYNYYADNTLEGGAGNDVLKLNSGYNNSNGYSNSFRGGTGDDRLVGGASTDTYYFDRGDGQDVIVDSANWGNATDRIVFGAGIAQSDLAYSKSGNDLVIKISDPNNPSAADQVKIEGWYNGDYLRIESFQFADGSSLTKAQVHALAATITGTSGSDTLSGWWEANTINGLGGNDTITDEDGSDTIDGGDGDDVITDQGGGVNTLRGGNGNDTITYNYYSDNTLEGGSGNDVIQLNSGYNNSNGYSNSFRGGTGNDRLVGGSSVDTYLFDRGDGQDTINDLANWGSATDKLMFAQSATSGNEISSDQLWFRRINDNLEVSVIGTTDSVVIENWYGSSAYQVEQIKSSDGKTLLSSQVDNLVSAMASFSPPAIGETTLPQSYQNALASVISSSWQ